MSHLMSNDESSEECQFASEITFSGKSLNIKYFLFKS